MGVFSWPCWVGVAMPVWCLPLLPMLIRSPDLISSTVWEFPMEALDSGSGSCILVGSVAVCWTVLLSSIVSCVL